MVNLLFTLRATKPPALSRAVKVFEVRARGVHAGRGLTAPRHTLLCSAAP